MLNRHDAFKLIENYVEGTSISRVIVQQVLGEKKYKALLKDKIRNVGWTLDNVYYWNVVDYMCMPEPPDEEENRLEKMYIIIKADGSAVDPNANYFVLRLDDGCKDKIHLNACRNAALAYKATVRGTHLENVGIDLVDSFLSVHMEYARYTELMNNPNSKLTEEEIKQGWHFCSHWDGLLIGPGMNELEDCICKREANNEQ